MSLLYFAKKTQVIFKKNKKSDIIYMCSSQHAKTAGGAERKRYPHLTRGQSTPEKRRWIVVAWFFNRHARTQNGLAPNRREWIETPKPETI